MPPEGARQDVQSLGRILIADGEETFRRPLAVLLQREGYACHSAPDGFGALRLLESVPYDLLIAEIHMPGNEDLELVHRLPALNAELQAILVTGHPSVATAAQALQLPVLAYLVKPLNFDELLGHLRRGMALRKVASTLAESSRHLERWVEDMQALRAAFKAGPRGTAQETLGGALTLALGNLAGTISDLRALFELSAGLQGREGCPVRDCPRVTNLEQAIQEGVEVLEATKDAFHSRKLRDLRQKLESLIPVVGCMVLKFLLTAHGASLGWC